MKKFITAVCILTLMLSLGVTTALAADAAIGDEDITVTSESVAEPELTPVAEIPEEDETLADELAIEEIPLDEPVIEEAPLEDLEVTENPQDTEAVDPESVVDPIAAAQASRSRWTIGGGIVLVVAVLLLVAANVKSRKPKAK